MQSQHPAPLTRLDVVLGVLRVQLWVSIVHLVQSLVSALSLMYMISSGPSLTLSPYALISGPGLGIVPVLLLLLFPRLLAANSLGGTEREPVASWDGVRPLIGRCVGLWLFVQSLGGAIFAVGNIAYGVITGSGSPLLSFPSLGAVVTLVQLVQSVLPILVFVLGFFLAFGPALRDSFRPR